MNVKSKRSSVSMVKFAERKGMKNRIASMVTGALLVVPLLYLPVQAQEISESHIAAAKKAIAVTKSTGKLNDILPTASARLAGQLISNRPDIASQISLFVDEAALELAPRRGVLQVEVAKIYARIFKEKELLEIADFFATEAGEKFLSQLPLVVREIDKASRVWGTGISRDLAQSVRKKMVDAKIQ